MSRKRNTTWRRTVAAYDDLRGRPRGQGISLLLAVAVAAAAAGALIGVVVDFMAHRRADARAMSAALDTELVPSPGGHDV